jgi:hypothetical protein
MDTESLLSEISSYCRRVGMAESTFGRLAVNDGKLVTRLRYGRRVTLETVQRVRSYIEGNAMPVRARATIAASMPRANGATLADLSVPAREPGGHRDFRFYDNRQKYLLFVTTCSEKWVIGERVAMELGNIHPRPPAVRIFDAGTGDGTVLTRVWRAMHHRFPTMPYCIVCKEISLEDVRLALEKIPDRFHEHPASVLVVTNMSYAEAPWLTPKSVTAATSMVWKEVALTGTSAHEFEQQITALQPFLDKNWRATTGKSGNPVYEKPVVLVLYRDDYRFLLDDVVPRRGTAQADYDLVIASQPYRLRASLEFKAGRVIAPLARSLAAGGRLIGIHSYGNDPGLEIIQQVWPGENPFTTDRHALLRAVKAELGADARDLNFNAYADARSLFRYDMHTLPHEISNSIGTSTLLAAWNACVYVNQIPDSRLADVMTGDRYLEATKAVLQKHDGLWFWDESYVISRRQDSL